MSGDSSTSNDEEKGRNLSLPRPALTRRGRHVDETKLEATAHMILPDGSLEEVSAEEALQRKVTDDSKGSWIDVSMSNDDEGFEKLHDTILKDLGISSFVERHLHQSHQLRTTQVLPLHHAIFIVFRVLDEYDLNKHVALLCLKSRVMLSISLQPSEVHTRRRGTQHWFRNDALDCIRTRELSQASVSGCLLTYLTYFLARTAAAVQKLRQQVSEQLERLENDVASLELGDIVELRNKLMQLSAVAEEQNECIDSLFNAEALSDALDFTSLKGSVGVVVSTASNTERIIDRLEKRVGDIRHGFDAHQQDRINHRLNLLTMMSAVFLPLTLMVGVWGMNFENMPELKHENAYYVALSSMAGVAIVLLTGFYWNGWLS